jgi:hypothetical protein
MSANSDVVAVDVKQDDAAAGRHAPAAAPNLSTRELNDRGGTQPVVGWREALAVGALVALSDLTIYHGRGFAGLAVLFAVAPGLLTWGRCGRGGGGRA